MPRSSRRYAPPLLVDFGSVHEVTKNVWYECTNVATGELRVDDVSVIGQPGWHCVRMGGDGHFGSMDELRLLA